MNHKFQCTNYILARHNTLFCSLFSVNIDCFQSLYSSMSDLRRTMRIIKEKTALLEQPRYEHNRLIKASSPYLRHAALYSTSNGRLESGLPAFCKTKCAVHGGNALINVSNVVMSGFGIIVHANPILPLILLSFHKIQYTFCTCLSLFTYALLHVGFHRCVFVRV